MLRLINDFQVTLNGPLLAAGEVLPLATADAAKLDLTGGGEYLLTLADSPLYSFRSKMEIVRVSAGLAVARAQEGTTAQNWESGDYVMCLVTAGGLAELSLPTTFSTELPSAPPDQVGADWVATQGGRAFVFRSVGTESVYDWQRIDRLPYSIIQDVAAQTETPAPVDILPHAAVDVFADGSTDPVQRVVLPAMKARSAVSIFFGLESADSITLEIDFSNVPGGDSAFGPGASVGSGLEALTITQSQSLITITLGPNDFVEFRLEIYTGDPALGYFCSSRLLALDEPATTPVTIA